MVPEPNDRLATNDVRVTSYSAILDAKKCFAGGAIMRTYQTDFKLTEPPRMERAAAGCHRLRVAAPTGGRNRAVMILP